MELTFPGAMGFGGSVVGSAAPPINFGPNLLSVDGYDEGIGEFATDQGGGTSLWYWDTAFGANATMLSLQLPPPGGNYPTFKCESLLDLSGRIGWGNVGGIIIGDEYQLDFDCYTNFTGSLPAWAVTPDFSSTPIISAEYNGIGQVSSGLFVMPPASSVRVFIEFDNAPAGVPWYVDNITFRKRIP